LNQPPFIDANSSAAARFSVIIVNFNGFDTLVEAVQSALREGVPAARIVIVDNGSHDQSLAQTEQSAPGILILKNGCNAGFAKAVNRGLAAISAQFYLLLNNDAQLDPGALAAFATAFDSQPKLALAGGQLRYPGGRLQSAFAPLPTLADEVIPVNFLKWSNPERYRRVTSATEVREVESVFGACLAARASAIAHAGPLDEAFFFYFEDVEWCRRMRLAGFTIAYVPTARAIHVQGLTANRSRSAARIELQRSKLLYFKKSATAPTYWFLSAFLIFRTFLNAFFGTLACVFTLFIPRKLRHNTRAYWRMFLWHLAGRPESWGLPNKCPAD
jgi:N-acetylglucosaminyl-diphospho-decaprenol L-rhamnosyltransferase